MFKQLSTLFILKNVCVLFGVKVVFFVFFRNIYSFCIFLRTHFKLLLKTTHLRLELSVLKCTRKQNLEVNICKISVSQFLSHIGILGAITNTCPTQGVDGVHQKVYTFTLDFKKCTPGVWCRQIKRAQCC
jgi:hypothetical protein